MKSKLYKYLKDYQTLIIAIFTASITLLVGIVTYFINLFHTGYLNYYNIEDCFLIENYSVLAVILIIVFVVLNIFCFILYYLYFSTIKENLKQNIFDSINLIKKREKTGYWNFLKNIGLIIFFILFILLIINSINFIFFNIDTKLNFNIIRIFKKFFSFIPLSIIIFFIMSLVILVINLLKKKLKIKDKIEKITEVLILLISVILLTLILYFSIANLIYQAGQTIARDTKEFYIIEYNNKTYAVISYNKNIAITKAAVINKKEIQINKNSVKIININDIEMNKITFNKAIFSP